MSYWLDTRTMFPTLKHDINTEVTIIGAGITGAAVSYWLSNKCRAVLIESETVASKASGRNAGFLLTGTSDHYNRAIKLYGHRNAKMIWKLTQKNHALLRKHIIKNNIECDYKRSGSYLVACSRKEINDIRESVTLLKRDGFDYKLIEERETNELLSSKIFHGSAFNAFDGEINPVKLVGGLVQIAADNGTHVFENTAAKKIERKDGMYRVKTKHGTITTNSVVLATNAYTPLINPRFRNLIKPVRGQILVTKPHERVFNSVFYANYGYEYWRQLPDNRILVGGFREIDPEREIGYKMITTKKIQNKLEGLLHNLSIRSKTAYRWSGIMGFTKDQLPLIGSIPKMKNLFVSAGFSGHGLGFSFIAGRMISEEILQNKSYEIFSPKRYLDQC